MKKCPTCDKTFDDSMRFCQIDGTSLVDDAPAFDPYATIVGRVVPPPAEPDAPAVEEEKESPIHATVGSIPISEPDDVLDLPTNDPLKTMYVSEAEMRAALDKPDQPDIIEIPAIEAEPPPPSFIAPETSAPEPQADTRPSFSLNEGASTGSASDTFEPNEPPRFNLEESQPATPAVPAPPPSPFGNAFDSNPKSSPFEEREVVNSVDAPISAPSFNEPEPVRFDEAATIMQPGFESSSAQPQPPSQPAPAWEPPPMLEKEWQNQPVAAGADAPFQAPVAGADGANKTLAVVSLITGILGLTLCCGALIPSIVAIVTGIMARGKVKENPAEYGGAGFATAGIVTGVIGLIGGIAFLVVYFAVGIASLNF